MRWLRQFRVHHWVKNGFVLLPAFFAGVIDHSELWLPLMLGFLAFSLIASAIYGLNDIVDLPLDRMHVEKQMRPLAAGELTVTQVAILSGILATGGILISLLLLPAKFSWALGAYALINIGYSTFLKRIPILDMAVIAVGFLLRIFAGGWLAEVPISPWLSLLTFLLALLLVAGKRRDELAPDGSPGMNNYSKPFLDGMLVLLGAVALVVYILYSVSPEVAQRMNRDDVYITAFVVTIGMLRYYFMVFSQGRTGSPVKLLYKDGWLQFFLLVWLLIFGWLLYGA